MINTRGTAKVATIILAIVLMVGVPIVLIGVQQAREAARRRQVMNNLKQLEVALLNYHERQGPQSVAGPTLANALAVIKSKQFADLTHSFEPGIPHWPGFPDEKRETAYWYDAGKGAMGKGFFA